MAGRPTRSPRWGYGATAGALVEPVSSRASAGFRAGYRPPAQWINYLLHFATGWTDYLRGPGWGAWTRDAHGGDVATLTSVTGLAVDTDAAGVRQAQQRYRYVIVGAASGPAAKIGVSKNGLTWMDRTVPTGATALHDVWYVGDLFVLAGMVGATPTVWTTPVHDGSSDSAIGTDDATYWDTVAALGGLKVGGLSWTGGTTVYACDRESAGTMSLSRSADNGVSWSSLGGWPTGSVTAKGSDILWDPDRARLLIVSSEGHVKAYTPAPALLTLATLSGMSTDANVRLRRASGTGTILAWASTRHDRTTALAATKVWRTTDGGTTWSAITLDALMRESGGAAIVTDLIDCDGVWLATTSAAPYLWRSDDDGQTWERVPLPVAEESSWALHRAVYADGQILATGLTWAIRTTRAQAPSPDDARTYSTEPAYLADAGYLRGGRISSTAPADGEVLVWDAGTSRWVPSSASPTTTRGDLIVRGASADQRLALGASSTLLVSDGTDAVWGSLDDVLAGSDGDVVVRRAGSWSSDRLDAAAGDIDGLPWHASVGPKTVQTTDATTTTAVTIATTTDKGHALDLVVSATKSDRSAQVVWKILATITNAAGACTVRDVAITASDPGTAWTATVGVSGTNVRVRVTGAGGTTVDWCCAGSMLVHGS